MSNDSLDITRKNVIVLCYERTFCCNEIINNIIRQRKGTAVSVAAVAAAAADVAASADAVSDVAVA